MFSIKKKLSSLIPTEGTRDAIQNVLTVEWAGHKTVLVEVPDAGTERSNEVELLGMGDSKRGEYGRLSDDEDQYGSRSGSRYRRRNTYGEDAPPVPPKPARYNDNPFSTSAYQVDSSGTSVSRNTHTPFPAKSYHSNSVEGGYRPRTTSRSERKADVWSDDIWHTGSVTGVMPTSPTSSTGSTGTRESIQKVENPFGN